MKRALRGLCGWRAGVVLFAVLAGSLLACILVLGRWLRPYNLASELAAAKAAGIPLTPSEFPQVAPPPDQNAAQDYAEMDALLQSRPLDGAAVRIKGTWRPETNALETLIGRHSDFANIVQRAASKPHAFYRHEFGEWETWPQLGQMQQCANWIRLESLLLARKGRYLDAVTHQALGYRFASHAGEDPVVAAYFTSISCEAVTLLGFVDILRESGANAAVAAAVLHEVTSYKPNLDITRCLKGEMLFGVTSYDKMPQTGELTWITGLGGRQSAFESPLPFALPQSPEAGKNIYVHWMTRCVTASQTPEPRRASAMEQVLEDFERTDATRVEHALPRDLRAICDELNIDYSAGLSKANGLPVDVMAVYPMVASCEVTVRAERQVVVALARIVAYRATTGRYPHTIGDAGIRVPIDPIGGKPFTYNRSAMGFELKPIRAAHKWDSDALCGCQLAFRYP